ncbi:hypothetical protein SNOG_10376 [Parastagonospora nodorum SN15]|uniref:FAD-binding PCMH-type domain-containing protein n=1 Tax=Phaeosphaeria nodorum (strain SN15 / ATCC MYA-4574 / FGSC 10173) TaxID=321614 RepID=Q0UCY8_PHANO|nr:hypothetical protein SNOG_10376 [Parastagonospora nodorum SN15]EAT81770.1 hypothetical protein SNOG_10376 [Parastagonospora nodorum SN15]
MDSVQLDQSAGIVSVGPGARWQKVYDALDPYQLSFQGGRNGKVGVAGFLLGVNFEVVLSSGVIVNANSKSHPDLFAALKGGQNNFGVVTKLQLRTFPQPPLWGGVVIYSNSTDEELLDAVVDFKNPARFDPYAMFTFGFVYDATLRAFTANIAMYHARPSIVNGSALETFAKIQPQIFNSIRIDSPGSFAGEKISPVVKQYYYLSANLTVAISIQSVPATAPSSNPNILGFAAGSEAEKRLLNIGLAIQYEDPAATAGLDIATKRLAAQIDQIAIEEGVYDAHLYMNYAGSWQNVLGGYGQESLVVLREVSSSTSGSMLGSEINDLMQSTLGWSSRPDGERA